MADLDDFRLATSSSYAFGGNIYYRPPQTHRVDTSGSTPSLPTPHIRARIRRPQSIHILKYPAGYIPPDLRQRTPKKRKRDRVKEDKRKTSGVESRQGQAPGSIEKPSARTWEKLLAPLKLHLTTKFSVKETSKSPTESTPSSSRPSISSEQSLTQPQQMTAEPAPTLHPLSNMVDSRRAPVLGTTLQQSHRNSIMSMRSAKNVMSSVTELPKPVASGSGVSCSIILAEPTVFLSGFDHEGHPRHESANSTALLRGKLQLNVSKNIKLRSVTLKLVGKARTEWPEGIPPMKVDQYEEESLRTQVLTFFNAMHETWETEYGNQCTYAIRGNSEHTPIDNASQSQLSLAPKKQYGNQLTAKDYKRLSLQSVQQRSFGKGESPAGSAVQVKGYKVFYPGTYEYSFELPIDHHQLETAKLQFGSVKWELETLIERAGAFKPNLHGTKEVAIVRVPDQLSLEMTEPISISRKWEDQLFYDIIISGKSFPIGSKIPIAFKLTPLAKVQVHKLKVFVTESIEYWTNDRRVTRKDPGRKILLVEKSAGKPLDKQYENSEIRVLSGGELSPQERQNARAAASRRRNAEASRANSAPEPLPEPTENLLGDLDLGLESYWAATEIEMNVQIPTCEQMAKDKNVRLNPDCSWKNVHVYHWIKIVMRISRLDPEDPAGKRRRHFEISIDSPFTVLNCRATQANTSLPEYCGADQPMYRQQTSCGCPDSNIVATNPSPASSTGTIPSVEPTPAAAAAAAATAETMNPPLVPPPTAHIGTMAHAGGTQAVQRPMHLLRYPSFNPPAFDEDEAPPPLPTPPPLYDVVVGTPSVDGLADYFARLADYDDGDSDSADEGMHMRRSVTRNGRVNVANPRTPGGRVPSRSLELERPTLPLTLSMAGALSERRG